MDLGLHFSEGRCIFPLVYIAYVNEILCAIGDTAKQTRYQVKPLGDRPYRLFWCSANINQYACQKKFREWHHDQTESHTTGLRFWTNSTNDHTYMSEESVSQVSVIYRCHRLYSEMLMVWVYHTKTTCYNSTCIFVTRMYNRKRKRYISSRVKSRYTIILCNFRFR